MFRVGSLFSFFVVCCFTHGTYPYLRAPGHLFKHPPIQARRMDLSLVERRDLLVGRLLVQRQLRNSSGSTRSRRRRFDDDGAIRLLDDDDADVLAETEADGYARDLLRCCWYAASSAMVQDVDQKDVNQKDEEDVGDGCDTANHVDDNQENNHNHNQHHRRKNHHNEQRPEQHARRLACTKLVDEILDVCDGDDAAIDAITAAAAAAATPTASIAPTTAPTAPTNPTATSDPEADFPQRRNLSTLPSRRPPGRHSSLTTATTAATTLTATSSTASTSAAIATATATATTTIAMDVDMDMDATTAVTTAPQKDDVQIRDWMQRMHEFQQQNQQLGNSAVTVVPSCLHDLASIPYSKVSCQARSVYLPDLPSPPCPSRYPSYRHPPPSIYTHIAH